jgi:hypothetical protein
MSRRTWDAGQDVPSPAARHTVQRNLPELNRVRAALPPPFVNLVRTRRVREREVQHS